MRLPNIFNEIRAFSKYKGLTDYAIKKSLGVTKKDLLYRELLKLEKARDRNTQLDLSITIERIFMAAHFIALISFAVDVKPFKMLDHQHLRVVEDICKHFGN